MIEKFLDMPTPSGKTMREYALEASILDLEDDPTMLEGTVKDLIQIY